ncbi:MAG TPA: hypothetical protein VHF87_22615 [Methylomirabilota bacterium]|nr:hypothetical protein [Methylomirabilota bacterium]
MTPEKDPPEIRLSTEGLYREELFTDRQVGSIRKLTPVRADGSDDSGRKLIFEGETSLLTSAGTLPLHFEIEADTLAEALERFSSTAQRALTRALEEIEELRREAASSLIVPGHGSLSIGDVGRPGGNVRRP